MYRLNNFTSIQTCFFLEQCSKDNSVLALASNGGVLAADTVLLNILFIFVWTKVTVFVP